MNSQSHFVTSKKLEKEYNKLIPRKRKIILQIRMGINKTKKKKKKMENLKTPTNILSQNSI